MIAQKPDANQKGIIEAAEAAGAAVIKMDRLAGFDLLVITRRGNFIVEVKNPKYKWELTDNEEETRRKVEEHGGQYHIVQYEQEIIDLIRW